MTLMGQRDALAAMELKVIPVILTIWIAIQTNLIGGYCFYLASFKYTDYDSAELMTMCEDAATAQMLVVSSAAASKLGTDVEEEVAEE